MSSKAGLLQQLDFPSSVGFRWLSCLHASSPHISRLLDHQSLAIKGTYLEKSKQCEAKAAKACLLKLIG